MSQKPAQSRLAHTVERARLAKGWSKEQAARAAGISSITWKRVEDDEPVQDAKLAAVEVALGWPPGHAQQLKAGLVSPFGEDEPFVADRGRGDRSPGISNEDVVALIKRQRDELDAILERLGDGPVEGAQ